MLRKGIISDIVEYVFDAPEYERDVDRALCNFFDVQSPKRIVAKDPSFTDPASQATMLFTEWLVYDYVTTRGKTIMQEMVEKNPLHVPFADVAVYQDLTHTICGLWYIISAVPGRVEVESAHTREKYVVREYSAAPFMKPNDTYAMRVSKVDDRYECVGSTALSLNTKMDESMRAFLRESKPLCTARDIYRTFIAPDRGKKKSGHDTVLNRDVSNDAPRSSYTAIRDRLKRALITTKLSHLISVAHIARWIKESERYEHTISFPVGIVQGLLPQDLPHTDVEELIAAYTDFANNAPRNSLSGKTLYQISQDPQEQPSPDDRP